MGQNCFSPPNYEALLDKLWPAAPAVFRLWGTNNELSITYYAAALASLQIGASQARWLTFLWFGQWDKQCWLSYYFLGQVHRVSLSQLVSFVSSMGLALTQWDNMRGIHVLNWSSSIWNTDCSTYSQSMSRCCKYTHTHTLKRNTDTLCSPLC